MYLDHFGLREAPFRITPHTEFFFAGGKRGATLDALVYASTQDEGIVKVSGEVGSGKTMLCRMLLERLPDNVETAYLANPSLSRGEILFALAAELGMPLPEGRTQLLLRALQERLIEIHAAGKQVVVLIDEAHAMPAETLEEVRLLSNLETNRHKLLHIVLFGQPELDARLAQSEMRQLKERITHNFGLEPLQRTDIASYLMFRMRTAGYRGPDLFTAGAIRLIDRSSRGLTRRINIFADKALLSAFAQGTHQVDQRQAEAAIRDAQFAPMADGRGKPAKWIGAAAILLAVGVGTALFAPRAVQDASATPPAADTATAAAVSSQPARLPTGEPTVAPAALPPAVPASMPAAAPPAVGPEEKMAPAPAGQPATIGTVGLGRLTAARLAASETWLRQAPGHRYFIQLLNADAASAGEIEAFLAAHRGSVDDGQLRAYRSNLSGRDRIGVIYGDYATRDEAEAALESLPAGLRTSQPYARAVAKLR